MGTVEEGTRLLFGHGMRFNMSSWTVQEGYTFDISINDQMYSVEGHITREYPDYESPPIVDNICKIGEDDELIELSDVEKKFIMDNCKEIILGIFKEEISNSNESKYDAYIDRYYEG
jgi:hypothetical protein